MSTLDDADKNNLEVLDQLRLKFSITEAEILDVKLSLLKKGLKSAQALAEKSGVIDEITETETKT